MSFLTAARSLLLGLVLAYLFVGAYWLASARVAQWNALSLIGAALAFSVPAMLALWHQATVRRLVMLHQFADDSALRWWGMRRTVIFLLRALVAMALSMVALLQSAFFGAREWWLLGLAPLLFACAYVVVRALTRRQFASLAYERRWSSGVAQVVVVAVLFTTWVWVQSASVELATQPLADRVQEIQKQWQNAPSGMVRWALDAGAWGQAGAEALGRQRADISWRLGMALALAPLGLLGYVVLSLAGLFLPVSEVRRTLGPVLTADATPAPVGPARAALLAAMAVILAIALFQLGAAGDSWLRTKASPLAVTPVPECEQIGGRFYALGTADSLSAEGPKLDEALRGVTATACTALQGVVQKVDPGIEAFLDWYFSLGGEWQRLGAMLTGNLELLMERKLGEMIGANREAGMLIESVQRETQLLKSIQVGDVRRRVNELLEKNRLVLHAGDCTIVNPMESRNVAHPLMLHLDDLERRVVAGGGAAAAGGGFAAVVAAKAASKAGMKTATKVLGKVVAKKAAAKAAGAGVGAAVGSVIVPGVGTAAGAVVGAAVGLVASTGIDMAVLAAEEKLTRGDLKRELQEAVVESLAFYRDAVGCE